MKDDDKTREQLLHELSELRSQNARLKKSITENRSAEVAVEEARRYAESIINTVRELLIALDYDLRVVSASRSFYEFFKVTPEETIGQIIYDLGNKQWDIPKLRELLETILPQETTFDNYDVEHDFATIGRRIMLLNARQIQRVLGKERIILLAIEDITESKQQEEKLRTISIMDDLTGLYNRRGFFTLAKQQMKVIKRRKKDMLLFFADLDKLKQINDTLGHQEGDKALVEIATILKEVFRESDIMGRIGGDEFAILVIDTNDETREVLMERLHNSLDDYNKPEGKKYTLSLSIGIAPYNPQKPFSLDELMAQADTLMYKEKRNKQH